MLVGSYPTEDCSHGWAAMVWTTASLVESITETVSLFVFATNTAFPLTSSAVGCRSTLIDFTAAVGLAVLMTLTVPVVEVPRKVLAGTLVPYELIVGSPPFARRPPSLLT